MEDLVEEVFGDIEDEYDEPEEEEEDLLKIKNEDGSFLFGASLEIDDINEEFDLELPEEEYYTSLGGLFTYHHEDIPQKGESIVVGNYKLVAQKTEQHRIILVEVKELKK
jgi:CBS domain containing-hemolysin-like protein